MTREELEKRLESVKKQMLGLQDEIQNLETKLAEVQDEPEIPDFPVYRHEPLYFVNHRSEIVGDESNICNGIMRGDFNAFHTEEYAQEFKNKCKLIAMMLHCKWYLDRDYVPNWGDRNEVKWDVFFDSKSNKFRCSNWRHAESSCVYFSSGAIARKCAEWLNEHWRDSE